MGTWTKVVYLNQCCLIYFLYLDNCGIPTLHIVLKADVDGTLEAIVDVLATYHSENCKLDIVNFGVGAVSQNDIELAELFNAVIYAFNVDVVANVKSNMDNVKIPIKYQNVIYKLIDDVKVEINKRLPLLEVEEVLGEAKVLQEFEINVGRKKVPVAGCKCSNGILKKKAMYRVVRDGEVKYTGNIIHISCQLYILFYITLFLMRQYNNIDESFVDFTY